MRCELVGSPLDGERIRVADEYRSMRMTVVPIHRDGLVHHYRLREGRWPRFRSCWLEHVPDHRTTGDPRATLAPGEVRAFLRDGPLDGGSVVLPADCERFVFRSRWRWPRRGPWVYLKSGSIAFGGRPVFGFDPTDRDGGRTGRGSPGAG